MKVRKMYIENYKSLINIDILFEDLTTIIGENDCGKTSIIDFLQLVLDGNIPTKENYSKYCDISGNVIDTDTIIGEVEFILEDNEIEHLSKFIIDDNKFIIKKKFVKEQNSVHTYVRMKKFQDERFNEYEQLNADELKKLLLDYKINGKSNQTERRQAVNDYIQTHELPKEQGWVEVKASEISRYLPRIIKYGVDDYNNPDNLIYKALQKVFIDEIYDNSDGVKKIRDARLKEVLDSAIENMSLAMTELLPLAKQINHNIKSLDVSPEIDLANGLRKSPIVVTEKNGVSKPLFDFGAGTKKRMSMSIMEWADKISKEENNIIRIYDEPDNNLHVEAQRKLFKVIMSACKKNGQAIICTHSPFLIDLSPIKSINLVKRNNAGVSTIESIDDDNDDGVKQFINNMCREIGIQNSSMFFEKCFVLVEGESEQNFLPIAYKNIYGESMAENGITIINIKGNGSALDFLKLLITNKEDRLLLIVDRDSTNINSRSIINKLKNSIGEIEANNFFRSNVMFIGKQEFEDCFSNEYIKMVLQKSKYKCIVESLDENIAVLRQGKFSDNLKNYINKNKGVDVEYITKPIFGTLLAESIFSIQDLPEDLKQVFNRINLILQKDEEYVLNTILEENGIVDDEVAIE